MASKLAGAALASNVNPYQYKSKPGVLKELNEGIGLSLSGGGYRAMLFHLGVLWRLNEVGLLRKIARVSSVSGGSITAAYLGFKWQNLKFNENGVAQNFPETVGIPLVRLSQTTALGVATSGGVIWDQIKHLFDITKDRNTHGFSRVFAKNLLPLFGQATLQDLPDYRDGAPQFYINATSIQTGNLFLFTKKYMGEVEVGYTHNPKLPLVDAIVASAAFPPIISPMVINTSQYEWVDTTRSEQTQIAPIGDIKDETLTGDVLDNGSGLTSLKSSHPATYKADKTQLQQEIYLGDGGIYDNLGVETTIRKFRNVIVSDAGQYMGYEKKPWGDFAFHGKRVSEIIDNQVRTLRKKQIIYSFISQDDVLGRNGVYFSCRGDWTTDWKDDEKRSNIIKQNPNINQFLSQNDFKLTNTQNIAKEPTALDALSKERAWQIVDWGYARATSAILAYCSDFEPIEAPPRKPSQQVAN